MKPALLKVFIVTLQVCMFSRPLDGFLLHLLCILFEPCFVQIHKPYLYILYLLQASSPRSTFPPLRKQAISNVKLKPENIRPNEKAKSAKNANLKLPTLKTYPSQSVLAVRACSHSSGPCGQMSKQRRSRSFGEHFQKQRFGFSSLSKNRTKGCLVCLPWPQNDVDDEAPPFCTYIGNS